MRILHVIDELENRSAARQLELLAPQLSLRGNDVHLCVLGSCDRARQLAGSGVTLHLLDQRRCWSPCVASQLSKVMERSRPRLVHTWSASAAMLTRLCRSRRADWAWIANRDSGPNRSSRAGLGRAELPVKPSTWSARWIERLAFSAADALVVRGSEAPGEPGSHTRSAGRVHHIAPAAVAQVSSDSQAAALTEFGFPAAARIVMAAGPLLPARRLKDLAWATDLLRVLRTDVHWAIVGGGPYRTRLEHYLHQCSVGPAGRFLLHRREVEALRPHAALYWSASDCDAQPLAMIEAMAAGVPVVAADTAAHRELVRGGGSGFLVATGDRAGFARAALKLVEDRELARQMGAVARESALRQFPLDRMVNDHCRLYEKLAA